MMRILSVLRNIFIPRHTLCTPLGRWQLEKCNVRLNRKIALSNEDHCGPCGEYKTKNLINNVDTKAISKNITANSRK